MLKTRILSALVIAPPILFAGWFGEWPFTLFVAICGFLMAWEWMSLCRQRFGITGVVLGAILALVAVLAQGKPIWVAFMILIVALPLISALAQRTKVNPGWVSVGV
ncbi:MAG: phosphatidate cytidylyltransferase, partial [Rhodospirillaceae bacterium]